MILHLRRFFTPPIFKDDEDKTRTASNLFLILRIFISGILLLFIAQFLGLTLTLRVAYVATIAILIGLLYLTQRGQVQAAALIATFFIWALLMTTAIDTGGIIALGYTGGGLLCVLMAGFLLHHRYIFIFLTLTILWGSFLAGLQLHHLLPPSRITVTPLIRLITSSIFLFIAAGLAYITVHSIQKALGKSRAELLEREKIESALRESEKRYRIISEVISDYAFTYDILPDGALVPVWINDELFQRMTGYTWDEVGASYKLYHPEDIETVHQHVTQTIMGQPITGEYRILTKNGDLRWLRVHRQVEWDEQQQRPIRYYGVTQNITAQKELEAELQRYNAELERMVEKRTAELRTAKEQIEVIIENTNNAIALVQPNGDVRLANPAFEMIFDDKAAKNIEQILWIVADNDSLDSIAHGLIAAVRENQQNSLSTRFKSSDGIERDVDITFVPVPETLQPSIVLSAHDITHVKELERFKERFVANAVHDLSSPISGLSTRLYLLKRNPEKLHDHVQSLERQVEHLKNLLEDLRTLSQLDNRKIILHRHITDFNEIIMRVFDTYEPVAIQKFQQLKLQMDSALPPIFIDSRQMERVIVNLVTNAINYTPVEKEIIIKTYREEGWISLEVADQGVGIAPEDQPRIFERFFRTDKARITRSSGTGLGLSIVKEIVEMHGGEIILDSTLGAGTTFTIRLPI